MLRGLPRRGEGHGLGMLVEGGKHREWPFVLGASRVGRAIQACRLHTLEMVTDFSVLNESKCSKKQQNCMKL